MHDEFEKVLAKLHKAEESARKAQAARDRAEMSFNEAMDVLRSDKYLELWRVYCDSVGVEYDYGFGDVIC